MSDDAIYFRIAENLDKHAGGAPKKGGSFSPAFMEYLQLLYTPEQAQLVQYLKPTREFYASGFDLNDYISAGKVAELSGRDVDEVRRLLDPLIMNNALIGNASMLGETAIESAKKTINALRVLYKGHGIMGMLKVILQTFIGNTRDVLKYGVRGAGGLMNIPLYALPIYPTLLNAHQFYPEVKPDDIKAGNLYREYYIEDKYYRRYEGSDKGTPTFRTILVNRALRHNQRILNSEEAHAIIDAAALTALVPCPCRTRAEKLGIRECKDRNPVAACIMLGLPALHFEANGFGKVVTKEKAKKYLDEMQDLGLVAATENFSDLNHSVICLCCECCCSMLRGRTRWDNPSAVLPSNFVPVSNQDCVFCGKCETRCPVNAISVDKKAKTFAVSKEKCLGCGVCTITCNKAVLRLERFERSHPPADAGEMYDRIELENRKAI